MDNIDAPIPDGTTESLAFDEFADGSKAGVVRLDLGVGSAESRAEGTVPVSGTVAVTGPLTDAQLRATAVPVSTQQANTASANVPGSVASVAAGPSAATTVLAAFAARRRGTLIPLDGDVYMSLTGTADGNSGKLPAGTPFNIDGFSGAVSMLGVDGTVSVSRWEY
jgi:hypothetical protein